MIPFLLPKTQRQRSEGNNSLTKCELILDDYDAIELMYKFLKYVPFVTCQTL